MAAHAWTVTPKKNATLGQISGSAIAWTEGKVWSDFAALLAAVGKELIGPLFKALRSGDSEEAARTARIVAETVAFKRALREARKHK
jgi:hypothetical protein